MHDVMPQTPVDPADFRKLMGQFATGVCVVSAQHDGRISGITVNSLVSVSLEPMLICWCIQNTSSQFDLWTQAESFAVSILAEGQDKLASRYAARGDTGQQDDDFTQSGLAQPVIRDALAYLDCRKWSLYPAGDHTMIFGEVTGIKQTVDGRPLGFFGGEFCRIAD